MMLVALMWPQNRMVLYLPFLTMGEPHSFTYFQPLGSSQCWIVHQSLWPTGFQHLCKKAPYHCLLCKYSSDKDKLIKMLSSTWIQLAILKGPRWHVCGISFVCLMTLWLSSDNSFFILNDGLLCSSGISQKNRVVCPVVEVKLTGG